MIGDRYLYDDPICPNIETCTGENGKYYWKILNKKLKNFFNVNFNLRIISQHVYNTEMVNNLYTNINMFSVNKNSYILRSIHDQNNEVGYIRLPITAPSNKPSFCSLFWYYVPNKWIHFSNSFQGRSHIFFH